MTLGILLILVGLVIAAYPQILVVMISGCFIALGVLTLAARWHMRRWQRTNDNLLYHFITRW